MALPLVVVGINNAAASSPAFGPYTIDGNVADGNAGPAIADPAGSTKELGPLNASSTKIGVIHSDAPPTLGLTNPNAQVDLNKAWLDLRRHTDGKDYLYFAWERDSNSGSGFIAYEFMKGAAPSACAYDTATDAQLVAGCNPFASRRGAPAPGDFMILWDQQGSSRDLVVRRWTGTFPNLTLGAPEPLGTHSHAEYSSDGFRGEAAVDLTGAGLAAPGACLTIANTVPSTVTGNSDTADYKDTILTTRRLTTCADIHIKKVDDSSPAQPLAGAVFTLYSDVAPVGVERDAGGVTDPIVSPTRTCTTAATGLCSMTNVPYGNYWVVETGTPLNHDTAPDQPVVVASGGSTPALLTFVNARQRGSILWHKRAGSPTGALLGGAGFTVTGPTGFTPVVTPAAGSPANTSGVFCIDNLLYGTYTVTETTVPAGYNGAVAQNHTVSTKSDCLTRLAATTQVPDLTFVNSPAPGTINVQKNDDATPVANPLQGAQFKLFQDQGVQGTYEPLVDTGLQAGPLTTSAMGTVSFTNVPLGRYCVVETVTPPGHSTADPQCVTVGLGATAGQGQTINLTFVDPRVPGTIDILKTDDASPANALAGARFTLYVDTNGNGARDVGETTVQSGPTALTTSTGRVSFTQVPLGKYCVVETTTPAGHATAPDQCVTVGLGSTAGQGQTISLTFVDPRQHKVIVLVCHEGTNTLHSSSVSIGAATGLTSLATPPGNLTHAQLCGLGGATAGGLPHGSVNATVDVATHQ